MHLPRARPWLLVFGAAIAALGVACSSPNGDGSDLTANNGSRDDPAVVVPAPDREPFWHVPILDADDELARFDGTLNGIRLGPNVERGNPGSPCATAPGGPISLEEAARSGVNVIPSNLPDSAELGVWHAVRCGGLVASVDVDYFVPADLERGFRGGVLDIYRRRGGFALRGDYPAERVQPTTLAGRPGIEVVPVLSDGLGSSAIILREDWGLTIVRAQGFTIDALREIALSLYDQTGDGLRVLDGEACDLTKPRLAVAPDGTGFLALSQGFILSRYDAGGCHVDDLVLGINTGAAFDVAWSPAGDRYAYAIVAPPRSPGFTTLSVSYFELRTRAPGEVGRDPYRAISEHGFPVAGDEVSLAWSPDGSRLAMLNGALLVLTDGDGDVIAQFVVAAPSGPPRWTPDGETLILPPGASPAEQWFSRDGERQPVPLAEAPDGSGYLALRDDFILARYDADGRHVADLALGINSGRAFDVAWSPAGDRYARAVVGSPPSPGFTTLMVSYFELQARSPGEVGRDPYRAIAGHGFPVAGDEVSLVWSPDGSRLALLNGTLLVVADEDGDVVARLAVDATAGPPRWTLDGAALVLPSGDSADEQQFTRDGAPLP